MVSIKTLAGAALAAMPSASAYIYNVTAPDTAAAGSTVTATLDTAIYVQNYVDYSITWGLKPASWNCGEVICVGTQIDFTPIYPDSVPLNSFTVDLTIPNTTAAGDYQIVAAIPYLVGASGSFDVNAFYANITITA
ncbi:hypothetical protein BKA67DRAFT_535854 [Truncatella angustata]|uniref:Uncharacterized protein n=1 Tax=Truncatella angustata TaxID=152316 RepID=A0A9P8ULN2_9PEZI|nr:uncharacterized protein BKA67DRAFT_535854 [Truncatella angustata]KAH6654537.1 hypothetical protein BKA67DRAFT_535854 [Truncatella angustata]